MRDLNNQGSVNRGIDFYRNSSRNIRLVFDGADSSRIIGEGNYESIGNVRILKADSVWNTINNSASFSQKFSEVITNPDIDFDLDAGMYIHEVDADITLSTDEDGDVFLGDLVGLVLRNGRIFFENGLICGQNASVWLIDGELIIGNEENDNFLYESVTIIDVAGNSKLKVAGSLRRRFSTSAVDFRIRGNALIEVMSEGAVTNPSERRAAFDFGEANSKYEMSGNSKVIIYKPMKESITLEKDPDYYVATSTSTITGGTVQFGDPSVNPVEPEPFNLIASTPFWNLIISNTHGNDLYVGSPIVTVRNDMIIGDNAIFNQNGNNLNIGGDFTIDGVYKSGLQGTRRVSFFGNQSSSPATKFDQTLRIKDNSQGTPFFDFVVNKSDSGRVILSDEGLYPNSNIILHNTLEFSIGNKAHIQTGNNRFVQVGTNESDLASIQRFGTGHVNGELRRWINDGPQDKLFTVGCPSFYTPARIVTSTGSGTPGLLSVTSYPTAHPDIANASDIQPGTHIDRYWRILPAGLTPFSLGDEPRNFTLTLQFRPGNVPAGDVKAGSSFGIFEHFRRTPAWDQAGSWYISDPDIRTDSTTRTRVNREFGDFVIGEVAGQRFFSAASGDWNQLSTWRTGSYEGPPAIRLPILETDRVFIGRGHTVSIQNSNPRVRSVTVEVDNSLPGKLRIVDERYLRGLSFALNDNCNVATDDAFGFTSVDGPTPNIGAIRTSSVRAYGKGTYEYIGTQGQAMGDGPVNPKTIIVNNTGAVNKTVSFSPFNYTIEDSLIIQQGTLLMGNGLVNLKGQFIVSDGTSVIPNNAILNLNGTSNQHLVMNDSTGISLYHLRLSKTSGNAFLAGSADSASLKIMRRLEFTESNLANIDARTNNKKLILTQDTSSILRSGSGHVDGFLLKQMNGTDNFSFKYEIGFGSQYLPATLEVMNGTGVGGLVAGIAGSPPNINAARIDSDKKINYFWLIAPWQNFSLGSRKANVTFQFPASEIANLSNGTPNNALLLRKSIPVESPLWKQREYNELEWITGLATVKIANQENYWSGLGEFYIGEKYAATFYSRQSGNWSDHNTWTYDETHSGEPLSPGEYPNPDSDNVRDNVYIGLNHTVTLDLSEPQIDTLIVRNSSRFDMGVNSINCVDCNSVRGLFDLRDTSTIVFGGNNYPSLSLTIKNFANYLMSPSTTIEYSGTQDIIPNPLAPFYSSYPGNLKISGVDAKYINVPITVNGNLYVEPGSVLEVNANSLRVYGNVVNSGNIFNTNVIEVGN